MTHRTSFASRFAIAASALALCAACGDDMEDDDASLAFDVTSTSQVAAAETVDYLVTGLTDGQAYRITLVVAGNVTVADGVGTFVDNDDNGAADAGASENVALITEINGSPVANGGAKTVPAGTDDPAAPTGIFPIDGTIALTVTGVAAGVVYPVLYENGGASTFLEINAGGAPIEPHVVGGAVSVSGTVVVPAVNSSILSAETVDYSILGLNDEQAYRITLVVAENMTAPGDGTGIFVDNDDNGAADAGPSELVALITTVNGAPVDNGGAKTVPAGTDDPSDPSGIYPSNGAITVTVSGVSTGTVYPVIYENGGASTFLEIDASGVPTETYIVGSATTVTVL